MVVLRYMVSMPKSTFMKKILPFLVLTILPHCILNAQDAHFTQYMTSPLWVNPAMTGLVHGDVRGSANYRSQWASVSPAPYSTLNFSYDMGVMKHKLPAGDAIGIGFMGLYDRSGSGGLTNSAGGLSLAYHKVMGKKKRQHLSVGIEALLVTKIVDYRKLAFEDMFDPGTGTLVYPTTLVPMTEVVRYVDYNAGIMYSGRISDRSSVYAGYSVYHIMRPVETFLGNDRATIHPRHIIQLGWNHDLSKNITLYTSGLYQRQSGAEEIVLGTTAGFVLNPSDKKSTMTLYAGGWYRYLDAICPTVGLEWYKVRLGLSYDMNISSFTPATRTVGAFEISLTYNGTLKGGHPAWNCPKLY